jgi:hypothetical protein
MPTKTETAELLRQDEAAKLLRSVNDLTTNQLMSIANTLVIKRYLEQDERPVADFDLRFFMEVMLEFCGDHNLLKKSSRR